MSLTTVYEDARLLVRKNPTGELFVTPKEDERAELRIGPSNKGLILTSQSGSFIPASLHGLSAIQVQGGWPH